MRCRRRPRVVAPENRVASFVAKTRPRGEGHLSNIIIIVVVLVLAPLSEPPADPSPSPPTAHPPTHKTNQPPTEAAPEATNDASGDESEAVCYLNGVHMSPYKVRRVLDVIRGKSYEECLIMLEFMPYRACEPVLNALFSAASNAKNNLGMNKAKLYVSETYADGAGTMKRFHPRAQGRPFPIRKRTCNITLKMKER